MADEPQGHRGHPSESEVSRAEALRPVLQDALSLLVEAGISDPIHFGGEILWLVATESGIERWSDVYNATQTLANLLSGHAAKHWSLDCIEKLIDAILELMR